MMNTILRTLIAALYLLAATPAQAGFVINAFSIAPAAVTVSFVGCTQDATNLTTYTFTSHATGTAGTRKTIVGLVGEESSPGTFSSTSLTVGGVAATKVIEEGSSNNLSAIYIIDNPSGTTATIVATFSRAINSASVCVYAAYDVQSATAVDTAQADQAGSAAVSANLDVPSNGAGFGVSTSATSAQTTTWAGMTAGGAVNTAEHSAAMAATTTAGTPVSVSSDWSGSGNVSIVTASFR